MMVMVEFCALHNVKKWMRLDVYMCVWLVILMQFQQFSTAELRGVSAAAAVAATVVASSTAAGSMHVGPSDTKEAEMSSADDSSPPPPITDTPVPHLPLAASPPTCEASVVPMETCCDEVLFHFLIATTMLVVDV